MAEERMAMEIVLDLQTLEVPEADALFGSSCTSSMSGCCNGSVDGTGQ
jgi:hypothetical protein